MWIEGTVAHYIVNVCGLSICVTRKFNQPFTFKYAIISCYQHIDLCVWCLMLFEIITVDNPQYFM